MSARHEETLTRLRERAEGETEEPAQEEELPLEKPEKRPATREYIVFSLDGSGLWAEETRVAAGSAESAIRTLGETLQKDTQYAACPSRNWSVGSPEVEHHTSIKIKFQ